MVEEMAGMLGMKLVELKDVKMVESMVDLMDSKMVELMVDLTEQMMAKL